MRMTHEVKGLKRLLVNTNNQMMKHSIFTVNIPRMERDDRTVGQSVGEEDRVRKTCVKVGGFLNQLLTPLGTRDRPPQPCGLTQVGD